MNEYPVVNMRAKYADEAAEGSPLDTAVKAAATEEELQALAAVVAGKADVGFDGEYKNTVIKDMGSTISLDVQCAKWVFNQTPGLYRCTGGFLLVDSSGPGGAWKVAKVFLMSTNVSKLYTSDYIQSEPTEDVPIKTTSEQIRVIALASDSIPASTIQSQGFYYFKRYGAIDTLLIINKTSGYQTYGGVIIFDGAVKYFSNVDFSNDVSLGTLGTEYAKETGTKLYKHELNLGLPAGMILISTSATPLTSLSDINDAFKSAACMRLSIGGYPILETSFSTDTLTFYRVYNGSITSGTSTTFNSDTVTAL